MAKAILSQANAPASVESAKPNGRKRAKRPAQLSLARTKPTEQATVASDDGELWGHLGIRLPGDAVTRWYPLSEGQAGSVIRQLTTGAQWIAAATLNNRALVIQATAVQRLVILDDNADEPAGDWSLSWSDGVGLDDAGYNGLWQCYLSGIDGIQGTPELKAQVLAVIEAHSLDEEALHALLRVTQVRHRDGTAAPLRLDARASWELFDAVQEGLELPPMLLLACWGEGLDYFTPRDQVALVDMPLHLMREAQVDAAADMVRDKPEDVDRLADDWALSLAA